MNENKTRYLAVSVLRHAGMADSTNNGVTKRHDRVAIECPDGNLTDPGELPVLAIRRRKLFGGTQEHISAVPLEVLQSGKHPMMGGNFIWTSDSRFPHNYPIPVHDRVEQPWS